MIKITILDSSFWSNGSSTPTTFKWTYRGVDLLLINGFFLLGQQPHHCALDKKLETSS